MSNEPIDTDNRRQDNREPIGGAVTVRWPTEPLVGSGENMSDQGVFFVAEGALKVFVRVPGEEEEVEAELVRIQAMGEDRTGIAVRFKR